MTEMEPRVCPIHGENGCDFYRGAQAASVVRSLAEERKIEIHGTITGRINRSEPKPQEPRRYMHGTYSEEPSPYHPSRRAEIYDLDEDL